MPGLDAQIVHRAHHFQRAQNPQHPVILAARRLGIEMAAHIDRQRVRVGAGAGGEHGAHLVDAHRQPRRLAPAGEELASLGIGIGQGLAVVAARDPGADLSHLHQAVPQACGVDPQVLSPRGFPLCRHHVSPRWVPFGSLPGALKAWHRVLLWAIPVSDHLVRFHATQPLRTINANLAGLPRMDDCTRPPAMKMSIQRMLRIGGLTSTKQVSGQFDP
ncbi:hypothetical protein AKL17_1986 [Frigidibacter mobilis]|uniref:Uncharacterized protein n=1 Tax=Frigidibacter mobilis TaxID=1335048 RepID=A0A159Z2L2_9RHOB|nr:hypothetical protein AKL17_1986 [Frigidibacter mobilis]